MNLIEHMQRVIEEGERIKESRDACSAECWLEKSKYLMSLNWNMVLQYQGSREKQISQLLDELSSVSIDVMDVVCTCKMKW